LETNIYTTDTGSRAEESELVPNIIIAEVTPQFKVGDQNYIQWRGTDLAGNQIVISEPQQVRIDMDAGNAINPVPDENHVNDELELLCQITIKDEGGSGVDPDTVEYSYSNSGTGSMSEWTSGQLNINRNTFFVYLRFNEGQDNYIQWRWYDIAGNGPTVSKIFNITVNSPPVAVIDSPKNDAKFLSNENIPFDASGSFDPDFTDELTFQWESNISVLFGEQKTFNKKLLPGVHKITLTVNDRHGHIVQDSIEITVERYIPPEQNETGPEGPTDLDGSEKSTGANNFIILILIVVVIIIVVVLAIFAVLKRRRSEDKKKEEEVKELASKMAVTPKVSTAIQTATVKDGAITEMPIQQPMPPIQHPFPPLPIPPQSPTIPQILVRDPDQIPVTTTQTYSPPPLQPMEDPESKETESTTAPSEPSIAPTQPSTGSDQPQPHVQVQAQEPEQKQEQINPQTQVQANDKADTQPTSQTQKQQNKDTTTPEQPSTPTPATAEQEQKLNRNQPSESKPDSE